ncbi:MAG: oligoendopeptidase F [Oscillospiraceae bacterium]|nr:oligoendopeptidase F [Oscillospiraceae bacterium]
MSDTMKIPTRNEAAQEDTWAIQDLFATDSLWWEEFNRSKGYVEKISAYRGRLSESGGTLLAYLRLNDELNEVFGNLINYAQRRSDEDTRVAEYQNMMAQLMTLLVEVNQAGSFETPELLAIPDEALEQFYQDAPGLDHYRLAMDRTRRKRAHILSEPEEAILAAAGEMSQAPDNVYSMLNDADLAFPDALDSEGQAHPVTHGTYIPLVQSKDRTLRKNAYDALYSVYGQFRNTSAAVLSAQIKQLQFFAKARKYPSTLHAALDQTEVPVEVYRNLIDAVHQNMDKMYRYTALRKKLLGVDELHMYDLYTPIVSDVDIKIPFGQAKELTLRAMAPLGEDYTALLREGFSSRWIDVYENQGKRSGAYSAGARVHPFVLLNYKDTLNDAFTLAHEMGHALHSYLSNKHQSITYAEYVIFVAEVASTCNEALLMQHLLGKTEDKRGRAYLINYFLEQFRTTLYRQTMFAEFELKINELAQRGEGLTAEALCAMYKELNQLYFGPDVVVDDQIALEWARIPHFYYDYYVYQYATGYAAAIALSRRILSEGKPAVDRYLDFLKGGCSKDPIALLRGAGVDMASPDPINEALDLFGGLIDEMEALTRS